MLSRYFDLRTDERGHEYIATRVDGIALLRFVLLNKGTAFTAEERTALKLEGLALRAHLDPGGPPESHDACHVVPRRIQGPRRLDDVLPRCLALLGGDALRAVHDEEDGQPAVHLHPAKLREGEDEEEDDHGTDRQGRPAPGGAQARETAPPPQVKKGRNQEEEQEPGRGEVERQPFRHQLLAATLSPAQRKACTLWLP